MLEKSGVGISLGTSRLELRAGQGRNQRGAEHRTEAQSRLQCSAVLACLALVGDGMPLKAERGQLVHDNLNRRGGLVQPRGGTNSSAAREGWLAVLGRQRIYFFCTDQIVIWIMLVVSLSLTSVGEGCACVS